VYLHRPVYRLITLLQRGWLLRLSSSSSIVDKQTRSSASRSAAGPAAGDALPWQRRPRWVLCVSMTSQLSQTRRRRYATYASGAHWREQLPHTTCNIVTVLIITTSVQFGLVFYSNKWQRAASASNMSQNTVQ